MAPRDDDPDDTGGPDAVDDGWGEAEPTRRAPANTSPAWPPAAELPPAPQRPGDAELTPPPRRADDPPELTPPPAPVPTAPAGGWSPAGPDPAEALARRIRQERAVGGIAGALFIALVVYACSVSNDRDDVRAELVQSGDDRRQLEQTVEAERADKTAVQAQVAACKKDRTADRNEAGARVAKVEADLSGCREAVGKMETQQQEARRKLAEFNAITQSFQKMIDTGTLEVEIRRGEMVVKLPAGVLFASGSAELSKAGKQAIDRVADVLATMPGRRFTVAGHTDNYPTTGTQFRSNWELSAARAVTVTEMLIAEGVKAGSLVAAGYGEHAPITSNKTERGRLLNRRIEIILEPDLAEVPGKGKGK